MNKTLKTLVPYMIVVSLLFYILPLLIRDTGTAMLILLGVLPLCMLLTGLFYGLKHGFNGWLALFTALLFLPTMFIYYNLSAWVYLPTYAGLVLVAQLVGGFFHSRV